MIRKAEIEDVSVLVDLLNRELSYGLMNEEKMYKVVVNKLYTNLVYEFEGIIVSFLSAINIPDIYNEIYTMKLEDKEIEFLEKHNVSSIIKVAHLVTEPNHRRKNYANKLLCELRGVGNAIFGSIWYQDVNKNVKFMSSEKEEIVPDFFSGHCPICKGECRCPAKFILVD